MVSSSNKFPAIRISENIRSRTDAVVVSEFPLTVILNDQELVTVLCSPANLDYLAAGFLFAEGILKDKSEIKNISTDDRRGVVRVTSD